MPPPAKLSFAPDISFCALHPAESQTETEFRKDGRSQTEFGNEGKHMKSNWRSTLYWITWTAFMVLTLLSIANGQMGDEVSELGLETIAPSNLERSHLSLEAGLRVEDRDFPVEQLTASPAYRQHLSRLAAYAKRLEAHDRIARRRSRSLSLLSLASALAMLIAVMLDKGSNKSLA